MFEMWLHFLFAYLVVLAPAFAYWRWRLRRRTQSFSRRQTSILVVGFWLSPLLPYGVVEVQTAFWQPLLRPAISAALQADGEHAGYKNCKVLLIGPGFANVYVVTEVSPGLPDKPYNAGLQFDLMLTRHSWHQEGDIGCIWSDGGNADGNVFAPYPTSEAYRTAKR